MLHIYVWQKAVSESKYHSSNAVGYYKFTSDVNLSPWDKYFRDYQARSKSWNSEKEARCRNTERFPAPDPRGCVGGGGNKSQHCVQTHAASDTGRATDSRAKTVSQNRYVLQCWQVGFTMLEGRFHNAGQWKYLQGWHILTRSISKHCQRHNAPMVLSL